MKKQTLLTAVVSALAASAIAGGVAWATIGDGGVIQGCYDSGGNLKVVAACRVPKVTRRCSGISWGSKARRGIPAPRAQTARTESTESTASASPVSRSRRARIAPRADRSSSPETGTRTPATEFRGHLELAERRRRSEP